MCAPHRSLPKVRGFSHVCHRQGTKGHQGAPRGTKGHQGAPRGAKTTKGLSFRAENLAARLLRPENSSPAQHDTVALATGFPLTRLAPLGVLGALAPTDGCYPPTPVGEQAAPVIVRTLRAGQRTGPRGPRGREDGRQPESRAGPALAGGQRRGAG